MDNSSPNTEVALPTPLADKVPQNHKSLYVNYVRAIAACAVVQMHTNGAYLFLFDPAASTHPQFVTADIFYSLLRWATPFFIMISGAMLIRPFSEQSSSDFLRNRFRRVVAPFAWWGAVYLLYPYRFDIVDGVPVDWGKMLHTFFYEDIYFHLWFIPMIMGLYILTPVLRIYTRSATQRDIAYFLGIIFVFNAGHHFFPGVLLVKHFSWLGYLGYYLLGYYLHTYPINLRWKRIIYTLGLLMPVVNALGTWWFSVQKGQYNEILLVYASPTVLITTTALFLYLRDFDWDSFSKRRPGVHRSVMYLADISFGVYFAHPLVLDVLKNGYLFNLHASPENFFNLPLHPAIAGPLVAIITIVISGGIIALMRKSPVLKKWAM